MKNYEKIATESVDPFTRKMGQNRSGWRLKTGQKRVNGMDSRLVSLNLNSVGSEQVSKPSPWLEQAIVQPKTKVQIRT